MYVPPSPSSASSAQPSQSLGDKWRDGPPCVLYLTLQPAHPLSDTTHPISHPAHPCPQPTRRGHSGAARWQGQPHCSGRDGFFWCLLHTDIRLFPFQGGLINFEKRRKVRAVPWQGGRRRVTWCKPRLCWSFWG